MYLEIYEFCPLVDHVKANRETFEMMDEQGKIAYCRDFLCNLYSTEKVGY